MAAQVANIRIETEVFAVGVDHLQANRLRHS